MNVGDKIHFGRAHGEKTLGEVVKVNRTRVKVKQLEARGTMRDYPIGTVWTVPFSLCSPVDGGLSPQQATFVAQAKAKRTPAPPSGPKRSEQEILRDIMSCYCGLSPENLSCDGEASRAHINATYKRLHARLKALFVEIGREVSEDEAYRLERLSLDMNRPVATAPVLVKLVQMTIRPDLGGTFVCETVDGQTRLIYPHRTHVNVLRPDKYGDYEVEARIDVGTPDSPTIPMVVDALRKSALVKVV